MARKQRSKVVGVDVARGRVVVRADAAVYPLDAVYGAAYEMLDRAWVFLAPGGRGVTEVELRRKAPGATAADLEALAGDLGERLLDHALRVSLAERHGAMREAIVARALSGARGAPPPPAANPPEEDPYDVSGEWQASRETPPGRRS